MKDRYLIFVLAFSLGLAGCAALHPPSVTGDLPHFFKVNDTLYRGGQPTEQGFRLLTKREIKTVVSFRRHDEGEPWERAVVERLGMRWVNIPFHSATTPSDEQIQQFFDIVLDPANQPVFVHCYEGKNRTGMTVALYRMVHDGWPPEKALDEAHRLGLNRMHLPARRLILSFPNNQTTPKRP